MLNFIFKNCVGQLMVPYRNVVVLVSCIPIVHRFVFQPMIHGWGRLVYDV